MAIDDICQCLIVRLQYTIRGGKWYGCYLHSDYAMVGLIMYYLDRDAEVAEADFDMIVESISF